MKLKAVFFDAGETLLYRNPSLPGIIFRHLKKAGMKVKYGKLDSIVRDTSASMAKIVSKGILSDSEKWAVYMESIFRKLRIKNPSLLEKIKARLKAGTSFRPYKDVDRTLLYLKKHGINTGIISNAPRELYAILKRTGITGKVGPVIISEEAGIEKPNKKIFFKALKSSGALRREFIYVGDNLLADIRGARGAGLEAVWLLRDSKHAHFTFKGRDIPAGVRTVKSLDEFIKIAEREKWF